MRVLFDAFWWSEGSRANRTVQREFIKTWSDIYPHDDIVLAVRRGVTVDDIPHAVVDHTRLWPHAFANRWDVRRLARKHAADVVIAHNYSPAAPGSIVFIHDVMFEDHPEWFSLAERIYFSPMLRWARHAEAVATSTAVEAHRIRRLSRDRLHVTAVGLGVPTSLVQARPVRPEGIAAGTPFALTVGRLNIRKNLATVMRAAAVSTRITPSSPLVIVGGTAHSGVDAETPREAVDAVREGRIVFLGALPDEQVRWLYTNAALTISLSLDEGFGMPALEGAWFHSPLLASDIAVYRETVGDYAVFVSPTAGAASVARAMEEAWGRRPDERARNKIVQRYTWSGAVDRLRGVALASGSSPGR